MRAFAFIAVIAVSLSGWGAFYYYVSEIKPADDRRIAGKVLADIEYKWKFQDSLKQEEETQKRNVLFVRQREFERQVEEESARAKQAFQQLTDEYRGKADDALKRLNESLKADLEKAEALSQAQAAKQMEDLRRITGELKADIAASIEKLAQAQEQETRARERDAARYTQGRQKDRGRIIALEEKVAQLQAKLEKMAEKSESPVVAQAAAVAPGAGTAAPAEAK